MVHGGSWREKGFSTEQGGRWCSAEAARFWLSGSYVISGGHTSQSLGHAR